VCLWCVGRGLLPALATSSDQIGLVRFGHSVVGLEVPWRAYFFQRDHSSAGPRRLLGGMKLVNFAVVQCHVIPAVIKCEKRINNVSGAFYGANAAMFLRHHEITVRETYLIRGQGISHR
jgi:hypothetical protein